MVIAPQWVPAGDEHVRRKLLGGSALDGSYNAACPAEVRVWIIHVRCWYWKAEHGALSPSGHHICRKSGRSNINPEI
jgi:hypothetical protein